METNQTQQNNHPKDSESCADISIQRNERFYSDEEITNIIELGDILQNIRKRLISEGLSIEKLRDNIKQSVIM